MVYHKNKQVYQSYFLSILMPNLILYILFFSFCYNYDSDSLYKFEMLYNKEVEWANSYIDSNYELINNTFKKNNIETSLGLSIIFPEIVRYNYLKDQIEITLNRLLYVNGGPNYSDLSIGVFQMKPSFIERLSNSKKLDQYDFLFNFKDISDESKRKIIINRLQDLEWQLLYLCYFINLISEKIDFSNISFNEKVKYLATAYNSGSWYNKKVNKKYSITKSYPYGPESNKINQYSYSDISLYYHSKFNKKND